MLLRRLWRNFGSQHLLHWVTRKYLSAPIDKCVLNFHLLLMDFLILHTIARKVSIRFDFMLNFHYCATDDSVCDSICQLHTMLLSGLPLLGFSTQIWVFYDPSGFLGFFFLKVRNLFFFQEKHFLLNIELITSIFLTHIHAAILCKLS